MIGSKRAIAAAFKNVEREENSTANLKLPRSCGCTGVGQYSTLVLLLPHSPASILGTVEEEIK